jgi:nitroimidazol reductase NimA-like FMN-containing flavoprotein (pyridoxamine 5'-phosphate oxidase superfamily)
MTEQKEHLPHERRNPRTTLGRLPERGAHDFETIARILDAAFVCHIGFAIDGQPFVVPTGYARDGRRLYIHGSAASRMLKALDGGIPLCCSVTLLDGLVLARSAFHHSMNYRSVMIFGNASLVPDGDKLRALRFLSEHFVRGRWDDVRPPNQQELKATTVLELSLDEASAKIRQGPPVDDEADYALDCWAGELPLVQQSLAPVRDPRLASGTPLPDYLRE